MQRREQNQNEGREHRRDAYDLTVLAIAFLALVAAATAAYFTGQQALIARDQTQRALRAYVIIDVEMTIQSADQPILVTYKAENMGQTPAYDLFFMAQVKLDEWERENASADMLRSFDCRRAGPAFYEGGQTFGKTMTRTVQGPGVSGVSPYWSVATGKTLIASGTACYRDIFNISHAVRICYEWLSDKSAAQRCGRIRRNEEY